MDIKSQMPFIEAAVGYMKKYRGQTRDVSSFGGVWGIDGRPEARGYNYACHALMDDFGQGPDYEYTTIDGRFQKMLGVKPRLVWNWSKGGKTFDDPVFKRFSQWLASERSPYRSLWKQTHGGIWVQGEDVTADDFLTKFGFIMPDLDVPANLLVNFFIMSRQYDEHRGYIQSWDHLVQHGAEPNLAMFFGHHFEAVPKNGVWTLGRYAGPTHAALGSWVQSSKTRVENFCRGVVLKPSRLYSVDMNYRPCNSVWGDSPDFTTYPGSKDSYKSFVTKTYAGLFGLGGGPRAFAVNVRDDLTITTDNLVRLINTEAERISRLESICPRAGGA